MYAFEIEDDQIRFCCVIPKDGKFLLSRLGVFNRPLQDSDLKLLQKLFSAKEGSVVVSIPRRKVSIHYHSFPTHQDGEILQMARYQALRQFPYRDLTVLHSVNILEKMSDGFVKVMLAVIGQEILNRYLNEVRTFILPNIVTINSLGLVGFYNMIKGKRDRILIDIDIKFSNLCVIAKGKLLFCREINKGFDFIREHGLKPWMEEVTHSVNSFNKERLHPPIEEMTILGPRYIKYLQERKKEFPYTEVEFLSQERFILKEENFEYFGRSDDELYSVVKLLGLSLINEPEINLTPPNLIQEVLYQKILKQKKKVIFYFSLALLGILLLLGWEYKRKQIYLTRLQDFLSDVGSDIELLEKRKRLTQVFFKQANESIFLELFREVIETLPADVLIRRLDYEKNSELVLEGSSMKSESIYEFYGKLKQLSKFEKIKTFKVNVDPKGEVVFYLKIGLK